MPAIKSLQELFTKELRDVYDAERQQTRSLPRMAKAASSEEVRSAFEEHQQQTLGQIQRLEQVFQELGERARGTRCTGMAGIVEEGAELLSLGGEDQVLDAALIGAVQKGEHYEIATYGTLVTFARTLGRESAADLLQQTLNEEKEVDTKLTQIAEGMVNQQAASQSAEEGEEEAGEQAGGRRSAARSASGRSRSGGGSRSGASGSRSSSAKSRSSSRGGSSSGGGRSRSGAKSRSGGRGR